MPRVAVGRVLGPPGVGKTTYLMDLITKACEKYHPSQVGAVSLTNAAVETIKDRIAQATGHAPEVANNVRTIHSHAFRLLQMDSKNIADEKIEEFCKDYPKWRIRRRGFTRKADDESGQEVDYSDESAFDDMQRSRARMIPEERWDNPIARALWKDWRNWMQESGRIDYNGMLEVCLRKQLCPGIEVLFVDEAQDLSQLAVSLMMQWSQQVKTTIFCGDSDQALYRFNGAAPEFFINLDCQWRKNLVQSWRVPPAIHEYALKIIRQAKNREDVDYKPDDRRGPGRVFECDEPDLSLPGTHMIICRMRRQVDRWIDWLYDQRMLWYNPYTNDKYDLKWNPANTVAFKVYGIYKRIINGDDVSGPDIQTMAKHLIAEHLERGLKTAIGKWDVPELEKQYEYFSLRSIGFKESFFCDGRPDELFKLSGKIVDILPDVYDQEPRVVVGTVHSVKGGESSHVWVDSGTTSFVKRRIGMDEEESWDEARVAYVAATRAKDTLGILSGYPRNPLLLEP